MNPQLIAEYDDALTALEAVASLAGRSWEEDAELDHDRGSNAWLTRWLHHPLSLLRVFDSIYARATAALSEVSLEIALLREHLAGDDRAGRAKDDVLARRAADLLCHEADLHARVGRPAEERILAARTRTLEMLRRALKRGSLECAGADEASGKARGGQPGSPLETYRRLAEAVHALVGAGDLIGWKLDLLGPPTDAPAWRSKTASGVSRAWVAAGAASGRSANVPAPRRP